jgi:hypothetical protein
MQAFKRQDTPTSLAFKGAATRAVEANPFLTRLDCLDPVEVVAHSFDTSPVGVKAEAAWERYLGIAVPHRFRWRGVRDSLLGLFGWLARRGRKVALPSDV